MREIWKFKVEIADTFTVSMPKSARFLSVQMQKGTPQMWFLVDPSEEKMDLRFGIRGTGQPFVITPFDKFLGTFQEAGGTLIWHLFEFLA